MVGVAMVAPAISPKRQEVLVENVHDRSPTRVADFEEAAERHQGDENHQMEKLVLGPLSEKPEIPTLKLTVQRESLPPLLEAPSGSSSEATGDNSEQRDEFPVEDDLYSPISPPPTPRDKQRERQPAVKTSRDEFMTLKHIAANLASRGKESEALKTYTRALRLMRNDLSKIKRNMKNALESTIASMQTQLCQAWVEVASEIAEIRTTMAILSERTGDYESAIKSCEEARIVYQSYANLKRKVMMDNKNDNDNQLEQMEHMLERLALAKASYSDRRLLHQEAVHVKTRISSEVDPDVKEELYDELFNLLATVLELEQDSLGKIHPQVADTIAMIAQVHADRDELEDALETMHSSVSIMRKALGPLHPRTAMALRDLARFYESKDSDTAIQVYEAAIETFRASPDHHAMVGSTLNNVAVLYIKGENLDDAVEKLSDALAAYESGVERGNALNPEVAQVWKNLGECYALRNEWESALFAYTSALGVQEDARRCHDALDSTSVDVSLDGPISFEGADDSSYADTMLRLAKATASLGRYDEAVETYEEALHIFRLMLHKSTIEADGHPSTDMVEAQDRIAHTLYCIAEIQEKNVQCDEAIALYTEAFDLRLRSDAVRADRRANMIHCAMCLAGIGSVHMQQLEFTDACLVLKESLHFLEAHGVPHDHQIFDIIARKLAVAERGFLASSSFTEEEDDATANTSISEMATAKEDRTLALDLEAQIQTENGDYDDAIRTLTKALAIRRKRLTKRLRKHGCEPNLKERNDVAKSIGNFAAVHFMKGDLKQAEALFTEAIRVYRSNGMDDDHPNIRSLLEGLQEVNEQNSC